MPGTALTLAAVVALGAVSPVVAFAGERSVLTAKEVAEYVTRPDCGAVRADTPEGEQFARHVVATIRQESGFRPWAIRDETAGESLFPPTLADAVRIATVLVAAGRVLGLGLGQITGARNLARHGLSIADAFDPCRAVAAAVRHLAGDVRHVLALSSRRYNTGSTERGEGYARSVAALEAALPADLVAPPARQARAVPEPPAPVEPPCAPAWDAWAAAACAARKSSATRSVPVFAPEAVPVVGRGLASAETDR